MNNNNTIGLLRTLGLKDAVGIGLGAIIGAGIYVVTGVAAGVSGPAFIIGLVIAGIIATFNGLSAAQLARIYPDSGGTYEYGYKLLSPAFGFSAGWMFLISKLTAAGVVALGFGHYFYQLVPVTSPLTMAVIAVILLTGINYLGIKKVGTLNLVILSLSVFSLLYLVVSGIPKVSYDNFRPFAPFGISGIAEAAALLFFAFTGYARITTLAEEVADPKKTIPRAIVITILTAILLYVAIAIVAVGVIGAEPMASSQSPLQRLAQALNTPAINTCVIIGASTAMLGVLLSQILGISRMMLAMGRRHDLPPFLQRLHSHYRVPYLGITLTGGIILLLTVFGTFEFILRGATFTILLYYSITNIAALKQGREQQIFSKIIPVLGLLGCLTMAASLPAYSIYSGIGMLLIGFVIRFVFHKVYDR